MTKDLASLIGREQKWLNTQDFLAKIDENLQARDGACRTPARSPGCDRQARHRGGNAASGGDDHGRSAGLDATTRSPGAA